MPGPSIPDTDHVSRLCGATKCDEEGRPLGAAFMLRPNETFLSVNWLEHTGPSSRAKQLDIVRKHLTNKGMNLTKKGRLAVVHLGTTFDLVEKGTPDGRRLTAYHEPELPHDPSHSGIFGYREDDDLIADLIAEAVSEHYAARA